MDRFDRGRREYQDLLGVAPEEALADVRLRSPQMYDAVVEGVFGGPLSRVELGRAAREMATVAILAASGGAERQLAVHARGALRNGVSASELRALCEHVALYAGFPRGLNALEVIDEVLTEAGIPKPAPHRRIRLADHETVVVQHGETGPAVLLVHGLGLDWRMWEPIMAPLAVGRRMFAYDIRGHGWAAGCPSPYTMADTADDLVAVLDALGLDRAHVVGLSYGGGIAQTAAIAHPERLDSLALLATTDRTFDTFEKRARSAETNGMRALVAPSLTRWFTPAALATDGWAVRYARERVLRDSPADWAAAWRAFQGLDVQGRLRDFARPVLVLAGELDVSTTPELMGHIARSISRAVYRELPGTPHLQPMERPDLVVEALDDFLPAEA